ncbi:MAG: galactokinase [Actinomycetia bacterium]|nr:galactokinase [Actinomycetes bacterium]
MIQHQQSQAADGSGDGPARVRARASGRVNLIGDHTDYMGGLVLPMAIDLATTVEATVGGDRLILDSTAEDDRADIALPVTEVATPSGWGRYPAAVAAELGATVGLTGTVDSTVPYGAGLSSSAALEVATALALMAAETLRSGLPSPFSDPVELALLCQRAEHRAVGLPSGIMDQLSICAGRAGFATLIDCATLELNHVAVPEEASIWVLHSGQSRQLETSGYAQRRADAEAATAVVGPLPVADIQSIERLDDPVGKRRARHVRTECDRVRRFADALAAGDLARAGVEMIASHESLRDDYEVSTAQLDALVGQLVATPGVHGARLTGAGFGGCVVALADRDVRLEGWSVRPSDGTEVTVVGEAGTHPG